MITDQRSSATAVTALRTRSASWRAAGGAPRRSCGAGADVEEPAEEAGKAEHVVDLVRVVAAPSGHDPRVTHGLLGLDLGHRVGHREDDAVPRHALEVTQAQS